MVSTYTLYNMVWAGLLPIKVTELPEALKRKGRKSKDRENKKRYGTSISDRPEIAAQRMEASKLIPSMLFNSSSALMFSGLFAVYSVCSGLVKVPPYRLLISARVP